MYDNVCKFLAETFSADYAAWLLGESIPLTRLEPSELLAEPIRADSVIFLLCSRLILHIEFQTNPDGNIPFRLLDYRVRLHRKYPDLDVYQVVIYLKPTASTLVFQDTFALSNTNHRFNIVRIWEQSPEILQNYLGLLPLAVLAKTDDPEEVLRQVVEQIEAIPDPRLQGNLAASTYLISGLILEKELVQKLFRSKVMRESVTYQAVLEEGEAKGKVEGKAEGEAIGKAEAVRQVALNMLNSDMELSSIAKFTGLEISEILQLKNQD
jgi:predicted transposase/invertase (TIGR01784 family)